MLARVAKVSIVKTTNRRMSMKRRAEPISARVPAMMRMTTRLKMTPETEATAGITLAMACFTPAMGGMVMFAVVPTSKDEGMELVTFTICPRPFVLSEYETHLVVMKLLSGFCTSTNLPWQTLVT